MCCLKKTNITFIKENSPFGLLIFFSVWLPLIWTASEKANAGPCPISVCVEPEHISLGGIALVTIEATDETKDIGVRFLGKKIPCRRDPVSRNYSALIGAGLNCGPGTHILSVKWQGPDGSHLYAHEIQVTPKSFPEERLSVPERMVEFPPKILERVLDDQKAVNGACNKVSGEFYWQAPFVWPVESKILSPFGLRRIFNNKPRSPHSGVDLRAPEGTPILASNYGKVALIRDCYLSGKTLVLDHGGGLYSLYVHLSSYKVKQGQEVKRGQIVGLSGATGRATGPHLHWGVSLLGTRLDPARLIGLLGS